LKKGVFIIARTCPSETNSSYVVEGIISKLTEKSRMGRYLRRRFVFKIVPMVNIDGVYYGRSRTDYSG
jgi:murein tripeptide amidase MpaA